MIGGLLALQVSLVLVLGAQLPPPPPSALPAQPAAQQPPAQPPAAQPGQPAQPIEPTPSTPSANSTATNSTVKEQPKCFFQTSDACANITRYRKCHALRSAPGSVLCCNLNSASALDRGLRSTHVALKDIKQLHLRNVTAKDVDFGSGPWTELVSLQHLAITDGAVQILQGRMRSPHLSCLNFSSNALTQLPTLNVSVEHLLLDISGNNGMFCASIQDFMGQFRKSKKKTTELEFAHNANTYYCLSSQSYNWFNTTERVSLAQVAALNSLDEQCPTFPTCACRCEHAMIDMRAGGTPTISVKVDCSGCGLTELPPRLPPHTISLNVSNNRIWNLTALSLNPTYSEIRQFLADNNTIASIDILEGSHFIQNFVELSLRSNNISALPIYILSSGFDRSLEAQTLNLGQNRLKCDCSTAQTVKIWLLNHKKNILDYLEVLCANLPERVTDLDQNKICAVPSDWTDYIYYIIAGEVALLILLVAKVSYDYWVFKTAGYLPWPASKMPKLPCDWVFE